jgi:hypothetical protein
MRGIELDIAQREFEMRTAVSESTLNPDAGKPGNLNSSKSYNWPALPKYHHSYHNVLDHGVFNPQTLVVIRYIILCLPKWQISFHSKKVTVIIIDIPRFEKEKNVEWVT